jgi:hypothetical protein
MNLAFGDRGIWTVDMLTRETAREGREPVISAHVHRGQGGLMGSVVLVHGAWHGAWWWDHVVDELEADDLVHVEAIELPFTNRQRWTRFR